MIDALLSWMHNSLSSSAVALVVYKYVHHSIASLNGMGTLFVGKTLHS